MAGLIDLTGKQFGRLTVIQRNGTRGTRGLSYRVMWLCYCECGNRVEVASEALRSGGTQSCGCFRSEKMRVTHFKHGHCPRDERGKGTTTATYKAWASMHARCYNPLNADFHNYGGRGIKVCARWDSFANFLADMGERPLGKTLDRYPNNATGNYEPGNVRWATPREQGNNRRGNNLITFKAVMATASEWADIVGIKAKTIKARLKHGWPVEKALKHNSPLWAEVR